MRRWLARLSMSFFVVAFALVWQGYKWGQVEGQSSRVVLSYLGAALCAAAGLAGTRERHRKDWDPPTDSRSNDDDRAA